MVEETKKVGKKDKLYLQIEKKFNDEHTQEEERKRSEKLKEIKELRKPVRSEDIESHSRKYEDVIRQKREELRKKRGMLNLDIAEPMLNYKSKFYEDLVQQKKETKEHLELEKGEKKRLQEKVGSYAKYVKEMYWPTVSENKRREVESVKENIRKPGNSVHRHATAGRLDTKAKNEKQMQIEEKMSHNSQIRHGFQSENEYTENVLEEEQNRIPRKPRAKKQVHLAPINQNNQDSKKPPKDYLREFQSKRDQDGRTPNYHQKELEKLFNNPNISEVDKYNLMKIKTEKLEQKAIAEE